MKKLYTLILLVIAISWNYSYAQTPLVEWPLRQNDVITPGQIRSFSGIDATLYSTATHAPVGSGPTFNVGRPSEYDAPAYTTPYSLTFANDQYLQTPNFFGAFAATPFAVPDSLTVTLWIYHDRTDLSRRSLFSGGDGFGIDIENNTLILKRKESYRDGYSEFPIVESKPVFQKTGSSNWYFVSLSYNTYFLRLYAGQKDDPALACSYQWMGGFRQNWSSISPTTGFVLGSNKVGVNSIQRIANFKVYSPPLGMEQVHNAFLSERNYKIADIYVSKNGVSQNSVITDAKVGDVIVFVVKTFTPIHPIIENLPQTWTSRFSGDLRYFVDASFTPNIPKPWIGFDTQVHWLNLRNFEQEAGRTNYQDWTTSEYYDARTGDLSYIHELRYVVNTPMRFHEGVRPKYQWQKFSLHKDAAGKYDKRNVLSSDNKVWTQRANQKEGLNMQILHYWNWDSNGSWVVPDYTTTYSGAPYMMGFDDDEILYANTPYHNQPSSGLHAILREPLIWQMVPVNETASIDETVNSMVSAFYQANDKYPKGKAFLGGEIKDYGTSETIPEGTGTWMHENGNIKIDLQDGTGSVYQIGINAESPLKKFYTIDGPNVVGREEVVDFTLKSFNNPAIGPAVNLKAVINDYVSMGYEVTFEYETQDSFGSLKHGCTIPSETGVGMWTSTSGNRTSVCTHQVYSTTSANSKNIFARTNPLLSMVDNTDLVFKIKTYGDSYCSVSLYLNKTDPDPTKSVRILLAGKDIVPVNLAFVEDQNLVEGTGEGGYFFVEQQRNVQTLKADNQGIGPFNVTRGDKFVHPFVRTYTIYKDQTSNWKAWDSDPHMFAGTAATPDHDWYQSTKKLALRVTDEDIESEHLIKYYFDNISANDADDDGYLKVTELGTPVSETRFWNTDYSTYPAGVYQLTAMFRGQQPVRHKVILKASRTDATSPMASVKVTTLQPYDRALLNTALSTALNSGTTYKVLEIQELSSRLMYLIGERNNYKNNLTGLTNDISPNTSLKLANSNKLLKVNRWGPFNDYHSKFYWRSSSGVIANVVNFSFVDATQNWNIAVSGQKTFNGRTQETADMIYHGYPAYAAPRFPHLWGNHFSSLWKSEGPSGVPGPSYMPTSALLYENAPTLKAAFDDEFFELNSSYYWQAMATLNSWSDSYGYRMRYNPSHVYSIPRVFHPELGAFSGAPIAAQFDQKSLTRQPYPGDNFMNLQAWYYDLTMGRKIIITEATYNSIKDEIRIYNDYNIEHGKLTSPTGYATTNKITFQDLSVDGSTRKVIPLCIACTKTELAGGGGRLAAVEETKADESKIDSEYKPSLAVYPNTVSFYEQINVDVVATQLSPMHFAIYDLTGRVIYEESSVVDRGVNRFTLDPATLGVQTEMIVIKVTTSELNDSKKIIVTRSADNK